MNRIECRKHINCGESVIKCRSIYAIYFLKVESRNCFPCHAIHFCNRYQNLNVAVRNRPLSMTLVSSLMCSFNWLNLAMFSRAHRLSSVPRESIRVRRGQETWLACQSPKLEMHLGNMALSPLFHVLWLLLRHLAENRAHRRRRQHPLLTSQYCSFSWGG